MLVLVCGDRNWKNRDKILARLYELEGDVTVIHGACRGADNLAGEVAISLGYKVRRFPADWDKHGVAAGPIRNREMLDQQPHLVIAFHSNLSSSRGTADTVAEARRRGIPVEVIS
jgi:hypothetical protein